MQPFPELTLNCLTRFSEQVECGIDQLRMKREKTTGKAISYRDGQQVLLGVALMTFLIRCC